MNKKETKAYKKQYYENNRETIKAKAIQYRKDNPKKVKAVKRRYYIKHCERIKAISKQYHKDHREKKNAYSKQYAKDHRKEKKSYYKNIYSIKRIEEKLEIGNVCACCGLKDIFNLTIDHIISKAMKRKFKKYKNFDIEKPSNLQILCYACNTSKNGHRKHCNLPHDNPEIKKMVTKARRRKSKK